VLNMTGEQLMAAVHALATIFMTGLIWFVQIVHYPLLRCIGAEVFRDYEMRHQQLTTRIVGPAMLIELATAVALLFVDVSGRARLIAGLGLGLLIVIWLSTALLQVPAHRKLQDECDEHVVATLIRTNWIRTVAWSARSVIALELMFAVSTTV